MEIVGGAEALRAGQSEDNDLLADNALMVPDMVGRHHGRQSKHDHHPA
jgi:hypothetical protein